MSELPKGWVEATVSDVGSATEQAVLTGPFGASLGKADFTASGVPVFTIGCLGNGYIIEGKLSFVSEQKAAQLNAYRLREGDLMFSRMATVGRVGFVPAKFADSIFNYHLMRLRLSESVIAPRFFYHYIKGSELAASYIAEKNRGATRDGINTKLLEELPISLPPLAEQKRIVAKLDALNAKSARARNELARIETLVSRYKQAVLRSSFLGNMTSDWRLKRTGLETASDLISRTPAPPQPRGGREATDRVIDGKAALAVNTPIRSAPSKWEWVPLSRVARQETGHTPSRSHPEWWDGDIPWIGIKDAGEHHGKIIEETLQTTNKAGLANSAARLLPAGTVCLSRTASVGYVTIMGKPMATSQDFVTWTCSDALLPKFLMYALMAEGDDIREFGKGTTHTTIYFPEVRAMHICLAPLEEQHEIVRCIESAFAKIDRLTTEVRRALDLVGKLDEAILTSAFRGELVPQDENDEPAEKLLERIRAERAAAPKATRRQAKR